MTLGLADVAKVARTKGYPSDLVCLRLNMFHNGCIEDRMHWLFNLLDSKVDAARSSASRRYTCDLTLFNFSGFGKKGALLTLRFLVTCFLIKFVKVVGKI